jgi:FecR protein
MRRAISLPTLSALSIAFVLCCSAVSLAQDRNREKFVISAKAGGINAITGQASVYSRGDADWQQLMITDDLNAGDRVRTANDGRVEILLNPGSYLRVGGNSEVELSNNALDNVEVRLIRGTAIVEATGADGIDLNINISTPHTKLAIVRQGLYRLNVVPGDATELIVRKGRVILSDSHTKVKGGNKVVFSGTAVSVAKLTNEEKKLAEDVDVWSKQRAETLAKANRRITNAMFQSAFASYRDFDPWSRNTFGWWFYNRGANCYTFLPFYFGWTSPYGNSYTNTFYGGPTFYPASRPYGNNWPTASGGGSGQGSAPASGGGISTGGGARPSYPTHTDGSGGGMGRPSSIPQAVPRMIDPDSGGGSRTPRRSEPARPD